MRKGVFGMNQTIKIYKPASVDKKGFFGLLPMMTKDLIKARELIWRLFLRNFKARYKQSVLGWGWIFILPLVAVGTFWMLNQSGTIRIEDISVPYPIYGLIGISLWQIFSGGLSSASASIISAGSFVVKINFSKEALVISSLGPVIVDFLVRIILILVIYLIYGLTPSAWLILLPILALPLLFLTLGLGFITSLLNAVAQDIQTFINVALGFFLFSMPIMYTASETGLVYQINKFNPVFFLISVPRDIIISADFDHLNEFLISSLIALIIFLFGWIIFNKAQSKIVEAV